MPPRKRLNIFVISDGTGATAESVLTSVVIQFRGAQFNITRFPFTRTEEQIKDIMKTAPKGKCIVVFTLVSDVLRKLVIKESKAKNLTIVNLMGPLISTFSDILQYSPKMRPGVFRQDDNEMYLLTEAIHFTLLHDDGLGIETIDQADLIILGVSRTGKTPTSIYLSCRKVKVANVPIINNVPLPPAVLKANTKKVGFRMSMERLAQLRGERVSRMAMGQIPRYSSAADIIEEQEYCRQLYRKIPSLWTIDVTNHSIEEISEWITRNVL